MSLALKDAIFDCFADFSVLIYAFLIVNVDNFRENLSNFDGPYTVLEVKWIAIKFVGSIDWKKTHP